MFKDARPAPAAAGGRAAAVAVGHRGAPARAVRRPGRDDRGRRRACSTSATARPRISSRCSAPGTARCTRRSPRCRADKAAALERDLTELMNGLNRGGDELAGGAERVPRGGGDPALKYGMQPYFREAGAGPGVVCVHSNASTSGQWRALMELLAPRFHVLAADSYGAGKSPPWPTDRKLVLRDEVALLEPVFAAAGDPFVAGRPLLRRRRRAAGRGGAPGARAGPRPLRADAVLARRRRLAAAQRRRRHQGRGGRAPAPRSTPATRTSPPSTSSTSGWARARGPARPMPASRRSPPRSPTCAAGRMR